MWNIVRSGVLLAAFLVFSTESNGQGNTCYEDGFIASSGAEAEHPYYNNIESVTIDVYAYLLEPFPGIGGITEAEFHAAMDVLADVFSVHGIYFNLLGEEEYRIDQIVYHDPSIYSYMASYPLHPNAITMYFTDPDAVRVGWAWSIPSRRFVVGGVGIYSAIAHEMGHCLGLYHTWDWEIKGKDYPWLVDGLEDCDIRGDNVCDTPAVPDRMNIGPYIDPGGCTLTQSFYDTYNGGDDLPWQPLPTNQMEYTPDGCRDQFTAEQVRRMFASIENDWHELSGVVSEIVYKTTPVIAVAAEYPLVAGRSVNGPIAIRVDPAPGYEVTSVEVDLSPLGTGFGIVNLDDTGPVGGVGDLIAGDSIWSVDVDAASAVSGSYQITVTAVDSQWAIATGQVAVEVIDLAAAIGFADRSVYDQGTASKSLAIEYESEPYASVTVDYDHAGSRDLLVSFFDGDLELYLTDVNMSDGGIANYRRSIPADIFQSGLAPEDILGLAVADFQGDGVEDFFASSQSNAGLFIKLGTQYSDFAPVLIAPGLLDNSTCGSWADYDRDGDVDLFVGRGAYAGEEPGAQQVPLTSVLLRNEITSGGGSLDVSVLSGIDDGTPVSVTAASWADVNDDGFPGLFVGNAAGGVDGAPPGQGDHSKLFVNNGDGTFDEQSQILLSADAMSGVSGVAFRDLDADGFVDLGLAIHLGLRIYPYDESLSYTVGSSLGFVPGDTPAYGGLSFLDFDLDGSEDVLLLPSRDTSIPRLYCNVGTQGAGAHDLAGAAGVLVPGRVGGAIITDMNGDGDLDAFLGRVPVPDDPGTPNFLESAQNLLESTSDAVPSGFNWIGVRLSSVSRANNATGIGARVTVSYGSEQRVRYVDGGSGRGGQESPEIVFSLGSASSVDVITVDWPNGQHQIVTAPAVGQYHDIVDDSVLGFVKKSISGSYEIIPNTELVDLVFTWKTNVTTNPYWDVVEFETAACAPWLTTLTPQTPGVDHQTTILEDGQMTHEIIWRDRPCVAPCTIQYTVSSSTDGTAFKVTSLTQNLVFQFCPSNQFPNID